MSMPARIAAVLIAASAAVLPAAPARAENEGRDDLDMATTLKITALCAQMVPSVLSLVVHPASGGGAADPSYGALAQYWAVGCLIFFYSTYAVDLWVMLGLPPPPASQQEEKDALSAGGTEPAKQQNKQK